MKFAKKMVLVDPAAAVSTPAVSSPPDSSPPGSSAAGSSTVVDDEVDAAAARAAAAAAVPEWRDAPTAMAAKMREMDEKMSQLLRSGKEKDAIVRQYNDLMNRYLAFGHKRTHPVVSPQREEKAAEEEKDPTIQNVLETVPARYRTKARLLMDQIRLRPDVLRWNERGQVLVGGRVVKNSNITDLINDAVRERKGFQPEGWQTFAGALKAIDVPQEFIGHRKRWEWMTRQHDEAAPARKKKKQQRWESYR